MRVTSPSVPFEMLRLESDFHAWEKKRKRRGSVVCVGKRERAIREEVWRGRRREEVVRGGWGGEGDAKGGNTLIHGEASSQRKKG